MCKRFSYLLISSLCLLTIYAASAQEQKTFKESLADLKKAFHPDKAFILPFSDSTNEDLQAFLFAVQSTKGVKAADLKIKNGKAVITVDTKNSMVSVWDNLDKEYKNRYTVTDRTQDGFVLADSYQANATTSSHVSTTQPTTVQQKQNNNSTKSKSHNR